MLMLYNESKVKDIGHFARPLINKLVNYRADNKKDEASCLVIFLKEKISVL